MKLWSSSLMDGYNTVMVPIWSQNNRYFKALETRWMNFYYFIVNYKMVKNSVGLFVSLSPSYVLILHQDSISVTSNLDNGLVVTEKVNNFKQVSELDSPDRYFHKPYRVYMNLSLVHVLEDRSEIACMYVNTGKWLLPLHLIIRFQHPMKMALSQ
jgi:hypothetical protein